MVVILYLVVVSYLVVVGLTVGEAFPLVVPISQERLLTLEIVKLNILFFIHLVQTEFFLHTVVQTKFFFPTIAQTKLF